MSRTTGARRASEAAAALKERLKAGFRWATAPWLWPWAWLVVRVRKPRIVGITGSVGKSTTKELVAAALGTPEAGARVGEVYRTPGNMNGNDGVPYSVLCFPYGPHTVWQRIRWLAIAPIRAIAFALGAPYPDTFVLEYAAGPGCWVWLTARLAPPTVAVVTYIGPAHLDSFGSIDGIVQAKSHLVRNVARGGLVILSGDNPHSRRMEAMAAASVVHVSGRGRELAENVARATGDFFGVPRAAVDRALADHGPMPGRLHEKRLGSVTLIDDAFNANPLSMKLALDTLHVRAGAGERRVAILGDMAELGHDAPAYHGEIGAYALARADLVIAVGALARHYRAAHWYPDSDACVRELAAHLCAGDRVLIKGSHAARLDLVIARLESWAEGERTATGAS